MDSTNFQQDHHHHHPHPHPQQQHYLHQQQQLLPQPPYPYLSSAYPSLLDDNHHHHLDYGVSSPPHHHHHRQPNSTLVSSNQGSYSATGVNHGEVPSASSGITSSDTSSFSYHSLPSNNNNNNSDDVMGSPNFLSNFLGIINQAPNDGSSLGNPWLPQVAPTRSINNNNNNSFSDLLSTGGGTSAAANALGQLGLTSPSSCFLGLNLQPSDLLNGSSCFGGGRQFSGYGDHHHALAPPGKDLAAGPNFSWPSRSRALDSNKASAELVNNGVAGTKRPAGAHCSDTSSKASSVAVSNKKSSLKASCPPFKVRKEKLGDRIAALHQLVSPFGKTDTASVLTEAIGYIQFLQDQIHTLCMPNVKPLRNKPCSRLMHPVSSDQDQESKEGGTQDLRKRGMCLVPLSWTSFITSDQLDASISLPHHYY